MPQGKKETELEKEFPDGSSLRKLMRIFRTNTVAKHHFQGGGSTRPVGTAKAFLKNSLAFQSSVIPGYTAYDRFARYSDYCEMLSYPIINKALQIIADEATQKDEKGKIISASSDNKEIEDTLQDLIDNILQFNGKKIHKIVRDLCKYGDRFDLIDITEENGVVNLIQMPANEVEREEGFDKEEPTAVRFKWNARNTSQEIPNAFVAHFRLDGDDLFFPYGQSVLEAARRPWRQLVLLEDAMMVYRITRSAERRAFYLDVMGVPPESVEQVVNEFNKELKKKKVTNDQGKIDLRYGATLDMTEDYIVPVRGADSGTRIETLPGGQNIGDIEDIEFIKANLFAALGIPKAFLTFDEGIGSKQVLTTEDIRFARTIAKIQECVINEVVKICIIHLYVKGVRGRDLVNFKIKMTNPSTVAEMQKNELWRARMELVQAAGQGVFDTTFIYKEFLKLSDDAIDIIRKGQIQDKIFQAKLMAIENSGGAMQGMGMGLGGGMGGMGAPMGMGGPMDMGLGGGLGGAPPNVSGMPMPPMGESFNPAAQALGNDKVQRKDLTRRNADERIATLRSHPEEEIFTVSDIIDQPGDELDLDGIHRNITSPMGAKESVETEYSTILKEYKEHTKQHTQVLTEAMDSIYYNCISATQACVDRDVFVFLNERLGAGKDKTVSLLKETLEVERDLNDVFEEQLERLQEDVDKIS